ncbi:uncharacterized protein LOC117112509 [Anneissia japonica]|uniref:uncharacterized protein LOC117112509 n=1 Tax=Anneissia japonica TaxID=1529436 RepID=UPI0014257E6B|nr:uncharacterized protein LOC117112509 [Anneissia japonica]
MMAASTSNQENSGSLLGLSDKNLNKLSVKIEDWYALAIELDIDDGFLKELRKKEFTPTEKCVTMLEKWRDTSSMTMEDQVVKLIETLKEVNKEEKAIGYLSNLLPGPSVMQIADFTKKDADSKHIVHDISIERHSKIDSIVGSMNQVVSVSGQSQVGNVAINPIAKTFVQATVQQLTEEQREEQLNNQAKEKGPSLLKDLQLQLKNQYKRATFTEFTPSQWSKHKIDIQDLFTDMIMFQNPNSGNEKKAKEIKIDDIAAPYRKKNDDPKRILIQGELGNGKTTLMKRLARSWADDPNKGVFGEKIVFFLELKNMQKKGFLENAIENGLPKDSLKKFKVTLQVLQ